MNQPAIIANTRAVQFTGRASEYFKIWIVNMLLTVLTLGIYSAWAKVRRKRYFYGNTYLDGVSFDYLADPRAILKGRLIAVGVYIAYMVLTDAFPLTTLPFVLAFIIAVPWLIVRSRMFDCANTAYRNVRFGFSGQYTEAIRAFVGLPLLIPFTLGLIFPYIVYRQKRFLIQETRYGAINFVFHGKNSVFYPAYLKAFGVFASIALLLAGAAYGVWFPTSEVLSSAAGAGSAEHMLLGVVAIPAIYAAGFLTYAYLTATVANIVWNHTEIAGNRFSSRLSPARMVWVYVSNILAIGLSFGLMIPWASIRLARYRVEHLSMDLREDLDQFLAATQSQTSATGEELGGVFGVDVAV